MASLERRDLNIQFQGANIGGSPTRIRFAFDIKGGRPMAAPTLLNFNCFNLTVRAINRFFVYGFVGFNSYVIFLAALKLFKGGFYCFTLFDFYGFGGFLGEFLLG